MAQLKKDALLIPIAKIYFMVMGYAMQFLMGHFLSKAQMGIFQYVNSVISPINMVMVQGGVQTSSHFVARRRAGKEEKIWPIMVLFFTLALVIFLVLQLLAPWISTQLMKGEAFSPFLRVGSVIFLTYSIYAVLIGYLNGVKRFKHQALFDMGFSTLKIAMIFILLFMGLKVYGVIGGWAIATFLIALIAFIVIKDRGSGRGIPWRKAGGYALPIILYQGAFYCLLNIDTWLLGTLSTSGDVLENGGNYLSITVLSKIPFQVILSLTFILFPMIAKSSLKEQSGESANYINRSIRYALILALPFIAVLIAKPSFFLKLVYGEGFIGNVMALRILTPGMVMLALFVLCNTAIVAMGNPRNALYLTAGTLGISGVLNWVLISSEGVTGAAIGSAIAFTSGFIASWFYLQKIFQINFPIKTMVRVIVIILLGTGVFQVFPEMGSLITFLALALWGGISWGILWISGEIRADELHWMKGLLKRK